MAGSTDTIGGITPSRSMYVAQRPSEQAQVLNSVRTALKRMRFLQETHATHGGPTGEMLLFEVTVNGGTYTTEAIKSDLRRIWKQDVAGSRDAVFTFVDTTTGFVFRFALFYTCREFVTGSIAVRITAPR